MANMGYCRFENTYPDLRDCYEYIENKLSSRESEYRKQLIALCVTIAEEYGDDYDLQ